MPRECTICRHTARDTIDKWLLEKMPLRYLALEFQVSTGALQRHKKNHLLPFQPPEPAQAFQDYEETDFVRRQRAEEHARAQLPPIPTATDTV